MATVKPAIHGKSVEASTPETVDTQQGLIFGRFFTDGKISPFDAVEWEKRTALIGNEKGTTIFRQENVKPLDCENLFPMPADASVYFCEADINGRTIRAPRALRVGCEACEPSRTAHQGCGRSWRGRAPGGAAACRRCSDLTLLPL